MDRMFLAYHEKFPSTHVRSRGYDVSVTNTSRGDTVVTVTHDIPRRSLFSRIPPRIFRLLCCPRGTLRETALGSVLYLAYCDDVLGCSYLRPSLMRSPCRAFLRVSLDCAQPLAVFAGFLSHVSYLPPICFYGGRVSMTNYPGPFY